MRTDFAAMLRVCRENAEMSQKELAERMEVSRGTVVNWENGKGEPCATQIVDLCELLGVDASRLLGTNGRGALRADERRLLRWFGRLTERSRAMALASVRAFAEEEIRARDAAARAKFTRMPFLSTPAAAGVGCTFTDLESTQRFVRTCPGADAVLTVRGDSMLPMYADGDLVYVRWAETAEPGENAVCTTADGAVIKRVTKDRRLCSLNPELPFGEHYADDNVRVLAVALRKVEPNDLPDADEAEILRDCE